VVRLVVFFIRLSRDNDGFLRIRWSGLSVSANMARNVKRAALPVVEICHLAVGTKF
jgi:hypothetical protein